jgi:hypothetical protein
MTCQLRTAGPVCIEANAVVVCLKKQSAERAPAWICFDNRSPLMQNLYATPRTAGVNPLVTAPASIIRSHGVSLLGLGRYPVDKPTRP